MIYRIESSSGNHRVGQIPTSNANAVSADQKANSSDQVARRVPGDQEELKV